MDRYIIAAVLFIVIAVSGYFGNHYGYTVDGVPHGSPSADVSEDWRDSPGVIPTVLIPVPSDVTGEVMGVIEYLFNFLTFRIDGVPTWMTLIFQLVILIALILIFSLVRGGGG